MGKARRVLRWDPEFEPNGDGVEFRLTYEGPLFGASRSTPRASHKHDIRRTFHKQLVRLWQTHPFLSHLLNNTGKDGKRHFESIAENFSRNGYKFVPLVREELQCTCALNILMLRVGARGGLITNTGDIDNRLKTLFDALRMPSNKEELAGATPQDGEDPFFCLLEDDKLITHVAVETDVLLSPVAADAIGDNDTRLVITVNLRPYNVTWGNLNYA